MIAEPVRSEQAESLWTMPLGGLILRVFRRNRSNNARQCRTRHSFVLGTVCKLIGVAYFIAVNSPLMEPLEDLSPWSKSEFKIKDHNAWYNLWVLIYAPAPALLYLGYRLSLRPWDGRSIHDTRRPILFLRPFSDDASTTLQPNGYLASLSGIDRTPFSYSSSQGFWKTPFYDARTTASHLWMSCHPMRLIRLLFNKAIDTSEESLAAFFRTYGPVRAIGRPSEFAPMPGADRLYVGDDWKSYVEHMIRTSQMIVIQPGLSEGVAWELEQVQILSQPFRVLFCLVGFVKKPGAFDELRIAIKKSMGADLPRSIPFTNRPCFVTFNENWDASLHQLSYRNPLLWPFLGDAVDLRYTLEPFIQGAHGGEREPPRDPRWNNSFAYLPMSIIGGTIGVILLALPAILIEYSITYFDSIIRHPQQVGGFIQSNLRLYSGIAFPYSVEVPESWLPVGGQKVPIEHQFVKNGVGSIRIVASSEYEDIANLGEVLLAAEKSNDVEGVIQSSAVESSTHRIVNGRQCTEVVLKFQLKSKSGITSHVLSYSGTEGMMLINVSYVSTIGEEQIQECESILSSLRFNFKRAFEPVIVYPKSEGKSK